MLPLLLLGIGGLAGYLFARSTIPSMPSSPNGRAPVLGPGGGDDGGGMVIDVPSETPPMGAREVPDVALTYALDPIQTFAARRPGDPAPVTVMGRRVSAPNQAPFSAPGMLVWESPDKSRGAVTIPGAAPLYSGVLLATSASDFAGEPPGFRAFLSSRPTVAQFQAQFPGVLLVLPGAIATREQRSDSSRFFAVLDALGRIQDGRFG